MDFPVFRLPPPPVLTPWHIDSIGLGLSGGLGANVLGGAASATWTVNNKAFYYPFRLYDFATAYQLLFWVGATSSGNIDVGIYDSQKNRIVSAGSTAMSATVNTWQEINITDTALPPGDYLLAVSCSTTAGTCFRAGASDELVLPLIPVYEEALGSVTLPDPATPVTCTDTTVSIWAIGIQFRSSPF